MSFTQIFLFLVFALCYLVISVHSLKCFVCSSVNDPGCAELTRNDTSSKFFVECPANRTLCRKSVQSVKEKEEEIRITRSCGWEIYKRNESNCYENDDDFKFDKSCQCFTDGCNTATTNFPKYTLLSIIGIVLLLKICI